MLSPVPGMETSLGGHCSADHKREHQRVQLCMSNPPSNLGGGLFTRNLENLSTLYLFQRYSAGKRESGNMTQICPESLCPSSTLCSFPGGSQAPSLKPYTTGSLTILQQEPQRKFSFLQEFQGILVMTKSQDNWPLRCMALQPLHNWVMC